jgi:hypothetical protein
LAALLLGGKFSFSPAKAQSRKQENAEGFLSLIRVYRFYLD